MFILPNIKMKAQVLMAVRIKGSDHSSFFAAMPQFMRIGHRLFLLRKTVPSLEAFFSPSKLLVGHSYKKER